MYQPGFATAIAEMPFLRVMVITALHVKKRSLLNVQVRGIIKTYLNPIAALQTANDNTGLNSKKIN